MKDPRVAKLADVLVGYSTSIQPGEKVLVEAYDIPDDVITALVERIVQAGGLPFVTVKRNKVLRALYQNATEEQMRLIGELETGPHGADGRLSGRARGGEQHGAFGCPG